MVAAAMAGVTCTAPRPAPLCVVRPLDPADEIGPARREPRQTREIDPGAGGYALLVHRPTLPIEHSRQTHPPEVAVETVHQITAEMPDAAKSSDRIGGSGRHGAIVSAGSSSAGGACRPNRSMSASIRLCAAVEARSAKAMFSSKSSAKRS